VSPRQLEIVTLMSEGHMNLAIAALLGVSEETVKSHVKSLAERFGSRNRAHTVSLAFRSSLLSVALALAASA
jgi:two-component system NarL family response regulator